MSSEEVTDAGSAAGASAVRYEDASKRYPGSDTVAVDGLSLTVPGGDICVLVGPSGCGKTTAMRLVNRTVELTSGDVLIGERSIRDIEPAHLRREIGYVIQETGLFPHRTIAQNIGTVPQLLGWNRHRIAARTTELLELIGLDPALGDRYPAQLSGGQQQRVGVARALAADPLVMLMDEPFGAIDPINRERLQNEFLRLQAEVKKTVLFVTHDIDEAIKIGDLIAIMRRGRQGRPVRDPGRAADVSRGRVRRGLRRRRPGAQAAGADAGLRHRPLGGADRRNVGQPSAEVRAKLAGAEVPYPLLVDGERRPIGWLSERDLESDTVPSRPDSPLGPVLDRDDIMRDALADMLQGQAQYAAVVDSRGRIDGVLSIEIISDFLGSPAAEHDDQSATERPNGG